MHRLPSCESDRENVNRLRTQPDIFLLFFWGRWVYRKIHPGLGALNPPKLEERPPLKAVSTGRCNTLVKSLSWRFEVQRFSWPLVDLAGDAVEMRL